MYLHPHGSEAPVFRERHIVIGTSMTRREVVMKGYVDGFEKLVSDASLLMKLTKTVGNRTDYPKAPEGLRVYWDTLCSFSGWKLQKNYYYDNCRIVDEYNVRRAWGKESDMISVLSSLG
jgi:hypothetical protein